MPLIRISLPQTLTDREVADIGDAVHLLVKFGMANACPCKEARCGVTHVGRCVGVRHWFEHGSGRGFAKCQ